MVVVSQGKALLGGDSIDIALDIVGFMGAVNELKKRNYKQYKQLECAMQALIKEEPFTLDIIKEFALNMTEIFS